MFRVRPCRSVLREPNVEVSGRGILVRLLSNVEKKPPLSTKKSGNVFASSLHLPQTTFPLRSPPDRQKDTKVIERITTSGYLEQERIRSESEVFSLLDGPPFANGQLHAGHFLNKVLKDVCNRFQMTRGKRIRYVPGWDCHGLPIELLTMKKQSKSSGEGLSNSDTRAKCRSFAQQAMEAQAKDFQSWGILANWDPSCLYSTMSARFEAKELLVLAKLVEKDLIFCGLKPVHWSPASRTALADAELEYRDDHKSFSIYCRFSSLSSVKGLKAPASVVIWTTTPWSLTGNMAVAVNTAADYVLARFSDSKEALVVAKERIDELKTHLKTDRVEIVQELKGSELLGGVCTSPLLKRAVPIIAGKHVTTDSGTGLVHIAPMHGLEDWECFHEFCSQSSEKPKLECRVGFNGALTFAKDDATSSIGEDLRSRLEGKQALGDGNKEIIEILTESDQLVGDMKAYVHRYPYDWRTKTPVLTMATRQFFIRIEDQVETLARDAIENTVKTFVPAGQSKKRLLATLGTRKEWCISRQRCWGLPIPYYTLYDSTKDEHQVLLSKEIVENFSRECASRPGGADFWFSRDGQGDCDHSVVDERILPQSEHNKGWTRGTDTLDVWFDSGSAWFASEDGRNEGSVDDLVIEGSDQHRGWFQSSLLTKVAVTGRGEAPFKALMTHGFVLDENGQKMSKSLGNVVTPKEAMEKYGGVDVLRLWACLGDATSGDIHLGKQSLQGAQDAYKKIRNMMRFILSCCEYHHPDKNQYQQQQEEAGATEWNIQDLDFMDKLILSELKRCCDESIAGFESFQVRQGIRPVLQFLQGDPLTVYLEQSKDTLYCDRKSSTERLRTVFVYRQLFERLTALLSPVCVFTCDELLEHSSLGGSTAKDAGSLVSVRNETAPSDWQLSKEEQTMVELLFKTRNTVNSWKECNAEQRAVSCIEITVGDSQVADFLNRLNSTGSASPSSSNQWTILSQVLQAGEVSIRYSETIGREGLELKLVGNTHLIKCERCRKHHKSSVKRSLGDNTVVMCDRCDVAHHATGL